jgi:transposase InsO family protein
VRAHKKIFGRGISAACKHTTYIPIAKGFVYLSAVVDVASRRVLTHKVAITLEACHAKDIIEEAFTKFARPESLTRIRLTNS